MLNYVHKLISVAFHTRNGQKSCRQQAAEDTKEMSGFFKLLTWTSQGKSVGNTAKERLKTGKIAKFKSDTFQETEEIALQRFENLPELNSKALLISSAGIDEFILTEKTNRVRVYCLKSAFKQLV